MRDATQPIRIVHISTGLNPSGAEYSLLALLKHFDRSRYEWLIIGLIGRGVVGDEIEKLGIRVVYLDMPRRMITLAGIARLLREIRQFKPDIIQGWMYHGSIAAAVAKLAARKAAVVWSIRRMPVTKGASFSPLTLSVMLKTVPKWILFNSQVSARGHEQRGFPAQKSRVIHNGFDFSRYKPDAEARSAVRAELGIEQDALVIGMVGRYTPEKNYLLFTDAARLILAECPQARFVLVGEQITADNQELGEAIRKNGIEQRTHLLGRREDLPRLMPAFDILALPSTTEGFPNVVGEAMACAVPCVVSDVSDNRLIVGDTGIVIDAIEAESIAEGCLKILRLPAAERVELGAAARRRVIEQFSLEKTLAAYSDLYTSLV